MVGRLVFVSTAGEQAAPQCVSVVLRREDVTLSWRVFPCPSSQLSYSRKCLLILYSTIQLHIPITTIKPMPRAPQQVTILRGLFNARRGNVFRNHVRIANSIFARPCSCTASLRDDGRPTPTPTLKTVAQDPPKPAADHRNLGMFCSTHLTLRESDTRLTQDLSWQAEIPRRRQRRARSNRKGHPMRHWKRFLENESGTTTVEYALLLGIIILVSVTTLGGFGTGVNNVYNVIDTSLPTR